MPPRKKKQDAEQLGTAIEVPAIQVAEMEVVIKARTAKTPLILHNFSAKSQKQVADNAEGVAKLKRKAKDPEAEFQAARYLRTDGRDGFPAQGIRSAMISACSSVHGVTQTSVKGGVFVNLDADDPLIAIDHDRDQPQRHSGPVRVGGRAGPGSGAAEIRYRPVYYRWSLRCTISYRTDMFNPSQILNLLRVAGFSVGLGEWRPEKKGQWGMFVAGPAPIITNKRAA